MTSVTGLLTNYVLVLIRLRNSKYCVKNWSKSHPHDLGQLRRTFNTCFAAYTRRQLAAMTVPGERIMKIMNQAEAEGWSEQIRRRSERIWGLVLLILLGAVLLISASLFFTARTPTGSLPSSDTHESGDSDKERAPAALTPV